MRKRKKVIASFELLQDKILHFATPHRIDMILLATFFFFFFIADLAQNKFLDHGLDYRVIVFWNTTALAYDIWQVFMILFHLALVTLFINSIENKKTHQTYDIIVGTIALFGVGILFSGATVQIYSETVRFLFMDFRAIDFYHIGVYLEIFAGFFWAFTD